MLTFVSAEFQTALSGRYRLERELGRGGMATVYLAHDLGADRPVALKVLRPEMSGALGGERFAREIAIAARLDHPSILPIYDSGIVTQAGSPPLLYFAMPYVAGSSLRDRLNQTPQLPVEEAVRIAGQVAQALDHAHRQGIVHRDIKPENILLDEQAQALVADFGIARALDAAGGAWLTETGLALGTPAYMSPEQGTGSTRLDGRADVYALGCVLYEMLAGQPPFTGPTAQAVLARHAVDPVPTLRALRPSVGPGLRRVVLRALAKVPADRYPTAGAFAAALETAAQDTTGEDTRGDSPAPRRRRVLAVAAMAGMAVLAVALTVKARRGVPPTAPVDPAVVAIEPFRITNANPALGHLHEGIVDLLASKLGGTIAVQPANSRTTLTAWRAAARGGELSDSRALTVAAGLGAGRVVRGEVAGGGGRVKISAALVQVPDGRLQYTTSVEGPADSVTSLVEVLAVRLLVLASGEPAERLPALERTSPEVRQAYLDGWTLFRHNDVSHALKQFEEAFAADSGFALAAFGAFRVIFDDQFTPDAPVVRAAWRFRQRLPLRDRALLETWVGADYPAVTWRGPALHRYAGAVERLTHTTPDNPDAWQLYGLVVCGDVSTRFKSPERCRGAYQHVLALDSTAAPRLDYAIGWAQGLGDTAAVRRARRLYLLQDSVSPRSVYMQWETATALGDTAAAHRAALSDSMVSARADYNIDQLWRMTGYFMSEGRGYRDVESALQRSLAVAPTGDQRDILENMLFRLAMARGQATGLRPTSWWTGASGNWTRVLDVLFADADSALANPLAATLERKVGSPGCCLERFAAAEWALAHGRPEVARRARADMERRLRSLPPAQKTSEQAVWPRIVAAQLAVEEQSPSAAASVRALDSTMLDGDWDWDLSLTYGNLIVARLLEQQGDYSAALAAIRRRGGSQQSVATFHREEGRIAVEAGDTAGAIRAYQRYLGIRADAEPRLQPQVRQVRAELAELERAYRRR